MIRQVKALRGIIAAALALGALLLPLASQAKAPNEIVQLGLEGVVDPFELSYIKSGIEEAEAAGASAVLITIDTPGGLESSMRKIVQAILGARVPVICYVAPEGARAASAGAVILISCPIAAMAPGTNVGAAHPVGVTGAIESDKATNDAAAFIRSLAEQRTRNADLAERMVRESVSVSAQEALDSKVIDYIAPSVGSLLNQADGRVVTVGGGKQATLQTAGATLTKRDLGPGARLVHPLFSPNLAFIFFYAGLVLIIIEILHPGVSVPGILGVILLVTAFAAFGMLPVQLVGVVLLVASVGFFLVELKNPGVGVATLGGLATLIVGGLLLFDRSVPDARVAPSVILPVALSVGVFFTFVMQAALKARRLPPAQGYERMVGATGYATTDIAPEGVVHIASESWSATAPAPIAKGNKVKVVAVKGLKLQVEPTEGDQQ